MGLDMYLSAKQYLFSFNEEDKAKAEEIKKLMGTDLPIKEVAMQAMYWRKANAIHDWFVSMVQEGEDDCKEYFVDTEQLEELVSLCNEALATKDTDLLQTSSGFFFGSTEYDEYYWDEITRTRDELSKLLTNPQAKHWDFYYRASW
jgi:hypothetical protein